MKQRLVQVLDNMKKYNAGVMYQEIFGFDPDTFYNLRANTRDFSHEIQPFLHIYFTNYYNIS